MRGVRAGCAVPLSGLVLALGCLGGSPPPELFTLGPGEAPGPAASRAARPELGLVVGPIELPRYLDRPEIVTRDGAHRLVPWSEHRWGGSLRSDILRTMAVDLGALLGTARIAVYPAEPRFPTDYRVLLELTRFDGVPGDAVTLEGRFLVASAADGRALAVEEVRIEQPVASPSFADLVAAHRAALGRVDAAIAETIVSLSVP